MDHRVEKVLNDVFICLDVLGMSYRERSSLLGLSFYNYNTIIMEPSGNVLFHASGHQDSEGLLEWLDTGDKMKVIATLGIDGYNKYQNQLLLAKEMIAWWRLYESAISVYLSAIADYPDNYQNYLEVAQCYMNLQRPADAIEYYDKAVGLGAPIDEEIAGSIINAYLQMEDEEGAIKWLNDRLHQVGDDSQSRCNLYLGLVELYEILQERGKALEYARSAVSINPKYMRAQFELGRVLLLNNEPHGALDHLVIARDLNETDPATYLYIALCYGEMNMPGKKKEYIRMAKNLDLNQNDLNLYALGLRPNYYKYPGYLERIEQGYLHIVMVDSTDYMASNNLAYFYAKEGIKLEDALKRVEACIAGIDYDNPTYMDTKAWILYKQGKYDEAYKVMNAVLDLLSKSERNRLMILYHLGKIQLEVGKREEAILNLRKAYSFPDPDEEGMRIKEDIREILAEVEQARVNSDF